MGMGHDKGAVFIGDYRGAVVSKCVVVRRAGGRLSGAEKGGTWVIIKKEFFDLSQNTVFWQILKTG